MHGKTKLTIGQTDLNLSFNLYFNGELAKIYGTDEVEAASTLAVEFKSNYGVALANLIYAAVVGHSIETTMSPGNITRQQIFSLVANLTSEQATGILSTFNESQKEVNAIPNQSTRKPAKKKVTATVKK